MERDSRSSPTIYYFLLPLLKYSQLEVSAHTPLPYTGASEQLKESKSSPLYHRTQLCLCTQGSHASVIPPVTPCMDPARVPCMNMCAFMYIYACAYMCVCICVYACVPLTSPLTLYPHLCPLPCLTPGWRPPITRQNRSFSKALKGPNYR